VLLLTQESSLKMEVTENFQIYSILEKKDWMQRLALGTMWKGLYKIPR
jgi:hypothetical protein